MTKSHKYTIAACMMTAIYMSPVSADWGSLLEDVTTKGKALLSTDTKTAASSLDTSTITSGLKQALDVGARKAIEDVSKPGGYLTNQLIHIAMPPQLQQVSGLMHKFGMGDQADAFEESMNRAAEKAAPEATNIIVNAIKNMSIEDAKDILQGPDNAATEYFKAQTSDKLTGLFKPTISSSLNEVGATKYYNDLTEKVAALPLVGENVNLNLPNYVTDQALNGLFTMIAAEEKKIRENPAARTTDLLKKVFSSQ
ncbi:hypothetical protein LCGC14_0746020 [marine sediment metagenome]|uniref:DUF4197 domain-containing protein n=1 Tax=marine sediment metagenome TaxID=412755 RepID=A0A0F9QQ82_9ZZZZ|nr:DUF4197 domain-containing protein [Methylophaga sp.]HEC59836.1 DUF4197 domain-containing protein [Methylophaga sp.]